MPEATQLQVQEPASRRKAVSRSRLDKAARDLNMLVISGAGLGNISTVGQFITEMGLMRYGNGRLIGSAHLMAKSAQACAEMAERDGLPDEVRQGYLELQLRFLKALDGNVALQLELNKAAERKSSDSGPTQSKSFLPGAQISPIQINVHGGTVETKHPKPEAPCPNQS